MNDQLDFDFSSATDRLVTLLLPNATPEERVDAEGALATFAQTIMLQTVKHIGDFSE